MAPLLLSRRGNAFDLFPESLDLPDRGILRRLPHSVGQDLRRRGGRRTQRRVQKRRRFAHQSLTRKPLPSAVAQLTCERSMRIGIAQINPTVGDLPGNFEKILATYERLAAAGAELVLAPELAITGYPPQDLVFKSRFVPENLAILEELHSRVGAAALLVGFVDRNEGRGKPFRNAAALLERGKPIRKTYKSLLPTYDVF